MPVLGSLGTLGTAQAGNAADAPEPEETDSRPRWPIDLKRKWAAAISTKFTEQQDAEVKATGKMPRQADVPGLRQVYEWGREQAIRYLDKEAESTGMPRRQITAEALRTAMNRATVKHVQTGSVWPDPPHKTGYKDAKREELLRIIRDALGAGFATPNGKFYFANVKEGMERSATIQAAATQIGLKTPQALWRILKRQHPELYIGKLTLKKPRTHAVVQVCNVTELVSLPTRLCLRALKSYCTSRTRHLNICSSRNAADHAMCPHVTHATSTSADGQPMCSKPRRRSCEKCRASGLSATTRSSNARPAT